MMVCPNCRLAMVPGKTMCTKCGHLTANVEGGTVGTAIASGDLVDALDVDASKIEHIVTGPWDGIFGGGPVNGSTVLVAGLAGAGKSTLLLQIAIVLARLSGKPAFYVSGEQSAAELKFTLDRLKITLGRGQLRLAKSMNSSGLIDDAVLAASPPSCVIVDSLSEICGQKQYDAQLALAKAYKAPVAVKYQCPVFMISQMNKGGDTMGMAALQHGPDALIECQVIDDGRRRARILRQYGLDDGDVRLLIAIKNRFGPTGQEFPLLMTDSGFTEIPKAMKRDERKPTGDPICDEILELDALDEQIEQLMAERKDLIEERDERKLKLAKMAAEAPKVRREARQAAEATAKPRKASTRAASVTGETPKRKPRRDDAGA